MHIWEGISLAFLQLRTEKLKSLFSLLGVILGVMFLIVVVTVVEGLDRYVREDFTSQIFGVNTVTLRRWQNININLTREERRARIRRPRLRFEDAGAIRDQLTVPARVAVESNAVSNAVGDNGRSASGVQVLGASPEIFEIRDLAFSRGRPFTPFCLMKLATCWAKTPQFLNLWPPSKSPAAAETNIPPSAAACSLFSANGITRVPLPRRPPRPTRCSKAGTSGGGPIRPTTSTSPMSIPTSRVDVATSTASPRASLKPFYIALRRSPLKLP